MKKVLLVVLLAILTALSVRAQSIAVKGLVKDKSNGETIVGATVVESGTRNAVISDINGRFSISVAKNAKLEVSFLGYNTAIETAAPNMEIYLQPENEYLDASVVTGYTKERVGNITGAVTVVNMTVCHKYLVSFI